MQQPMACGIDAAHWSVRWARMRGRSGLGPSAVIDPRDDWVAALHHAAIGGAEGLDICARQRDVNINLVVTVGSKLVQTSPD